MKQNQSSTQSENANDILTNNGVNEMREMTSAVEDVNNEPMVGVPAQKKAGGMLIGLIILAIVALGGIGFGVWAMMDGNNQVADANKKVAAANQQVNELEKQNEELQDKLDRQEGQNASAGTGGDASVNSNPVIKGTDLIVYYDDGSFFMNYEDGTYLSARVVVMDGSITECKYKDEDCAVNGLTGEIYKMSNLVYGNGGDNGEFAFLMNDGSVYYINYKNYDVDNHVFTAKKIKIDGFVKDIVSLEECSRESYGCARATLLVLSDNSFVSFDDKTPVVD